MSSPGLRERKKQKTRWAIQEHAVRLFAQHGYDATTVEQIAEAAEISPSTFFRYFKTKEDVVIQDRYDELMAEAIATAPPELSPIDTIRHAMVGSFSAIGPVEREQLWVRTRMTYSVPALRARSMDNLLVAIDTLAQPLTVRLQRQPDDFAVRAFVGACIGAVIWAVWAWSESDGTGDLGAEIDRALLVVGTGP